MGVFGFLPTVNRCCYCTKKLKVASVLITIWCMFTGSHCIAMCFSPACEDIFSKNNNGIIGTLTTLKWVLFFVTLIFISGTFAFLLGIFLDIPHRDVTGDVFIVSALAWAVLTFVFAVLQIIQYGNCKCTNPSDIMACFIYSPCMIYFIIIVSSYQENQGR